MSSIIPEKVVSLAQKIETRDPVDFSFLKEAVAGTGISVNDLENHASFSHPPDQSYGRILLHESRRLKIFLMCWTPGDFTAIHDHGSTDWGCVVALGDFTHRVYQFEDGLLRLKSNAPFGEAQLACLTGDLIHMMGNTGNKNIMSLHIYGSDSGNESLAKKSRVYLPESRKVITTNGPAFLNCPRETIIKEEDFSAICSQALDDYLDLLEEISAICREHDIWLHADGSFGGSLILSDRHRHLMKGIEKTDSFAWNPHKLMNIPLICSVILVRKRGTLQQNITDINTDYIFHDIDRIEDLGKKSIQCGRKVDAVKLWFAWKYFGLDGYRSRIDNSIGMAAYAEEKVKEHPSLELLTPRQSFAVCFRYIPERETDLNGFNLKLRESLRKSGKSIVNYGYLGDTLAIRLITANGELERSDIDLFWDHLLAEAEKLEKVYESAESRYLQNSEIPGN